MAWIHEKLEKPRTGFWPINQYMALGDMRTSALIGPDGSVDWLCLPQFDSGSVFGRILDKDGGAFELAAVEPARVWRRYWPHTNVIETRVNTRQGTWIIRDWMSYDSVSPRLNRRIRVIRGVAHIRVSVKLRPEYGLVTAQLAAPSPFHITWTHNAHVWHLVSDFPLHPIDTDVYGEFILDAGTTGGFSLGLDPGNNSSEWLEQQLLDLNNTVKFWQDWMHMCPDEGNYSEYIERSALTLKLLTYAPTGAIVAAPTTSLPEDPGGVRNWDYRYSWLRDASMTLMALDWLGHPHEGQAFFRWMLTCCAVDRLVLHPVVPGGLVHEWEHPTWRGYEDAHPVRIGNQAATQRQFDVYGEVLDAAWQHFQYDDTDLSDLWPFFTELAEEAALHWTEPDEGIWETRGEPQHFLYSKAQCWVALDRAQKIAKKWQLVAPMDRWQRIATEIRETVLQEGYSLGTQSFMQTFNKDTFDASVLLLPQLGIVSAHDPRMVSTISAIRKYLRVPGDNDGLFLYRYRAMDDGIVGSEHAFLLCSTWLIGTMALAGQIEEAKKLLERFLSIAPHGLFAEEYDPLTQRFWGNFPQAFTHLGVITAILHVEQAQSSSQGGPLRGCRGWPQAT
ncbi:glycoside hydrolase family 15 protein [Sulfobacillus thermosulfidooxidans]|uniref:glycoside hydrolase family 15 protein n=1 Tax=Sulfobacillus thermosulfidooxidans TaxID=28034 RepID=UPI00096B71A4|nr:glycoside hydrolase family 15 protein [Sulfobacillus thermosulfidooxidans]OLZ08186.1 hypothetical protein BFX05_05290 [Sulfobacillus thermosulfidooxidans]OLZ14954.1 hypothetical protein BFX06_04960 [Sulfobacillus thermosulfidooxidans]OLZ19687.1 hypothetical protein BFX07_03250 [Sulfobacillus thermosulfidooxidans]